MIWTNVTSRCSLLEQKYICNTMIRKFVGDDVGVSISHRPPCEPSAVSS
jgi:hypothetical protein